MKTHTIHVCLQMSDFCPEQLGPYSFAEPGQGRKPDSIPGASQPGG